MPKRFLAWLGLALVVIVLDQATKQLIEATLLYQQRHVVIPGFFDLTRVYNPGAAFSFLADAGGWQKHFFTGLGLVVSAFLILQLKKHPEQTRISLAFALVLGGALGNVIDRIAFGHVIDFLLFYIGNHAYPAFNIADSAICVGAALMVWDSFAGRNKEQA
ncbi:Lipoprotein signal peptidase [Andreprevotia sp. IGB-42]|uniref:signal peptidase II n=1 Tax=Andreprevotia sp. IGB-42 TaxID=2497473 RepID=UPI001358E4FB|nr:signal peptidase II [Andreprevotia sp. IGB-42]KAF0814108.1 Lipoprotein signal peptidase [Andreprevotia sp. IGB-42]